MVQLGTLSFLANFRAKKQVKLTAVSQNKIGGCLTEDTKY